MGPDGKFRTALAPTWAPNGGERSKEMARGREVSPSFWEGGGHAERGWGRVAKRTRCKGYEPSPTVVDGAVIGRLGGIQGADIPTQGGENIVCWINFCSAVRSMVLCRVTAAPSQGFHALFAS